MGVHEAWLLERIKAPFTLRGLVVELAGRGFKVDYRTISVLPDGRRPTTLFEAAAARGLAVGAVTTTGLTDATPAGFVTHAASRYDYAHILRQMLASRFDVLIGGDYTLKAKPMGQKDYRDALQRAEELAADGAGEPARLGREPAGADRRTRQSARAGDRRCRFHSDRKDPGALQPGSAGKSMRPSASLSMPSSHWAGGGLNSSLSCASLQPGSTV